MTDSKPNLKAEPNHEFARFATLFAYLWAMFVLFQIHQYVVLAQHHIPFTQFGVGFLNAFVLAKVILVADDFRLGEWRGRRPLIYPVLLRRRPIITESTGRRCLSRHCEELLRRSNPGAA
jgi:hypothetical protein